MENKFTFAMFLASDGEGQKANSSREKAEGEQTSENLWGALRGAFEDIAAWLKVVLPYFFAWPHQD